MTELGYGGGVLHFAQLLGLGYILFAVLNLLLYPRSAFTYACFGGFKGECFAMKAYNWAQAIKQGVRGTHMRQDKSKELTKASNVYQ